MRNYVIRDAGHDDMALAASIMVTSFRTAFADFVSQETMDACTNPDNCRAMLESIYQEGAQKAQYLANKTLRKVYKKVGFVPAK